jgi:hypothetical protein
VAEFDTLCEPALRSAATVLVFDLAELTYISSAGLRSGVQGSQDDGGEGRLGPPRERPTAGSKGFDVVKALPSQSVFKSVAELDQYLDYLQRKP